MDKMLEPLAKPTDYQGQTGSDRDHQQVNHLQERIIWMAGLWDGEGSITVFKNYDKASRCEKYCPTVCVVNTNPAIVNEVQKICVELQVVLHLFERTPEKKQHAVAYQLGTRKLAHVKTLLEHMLPYLVGKRAQAEMVLRFVDSRLSSMKGAINGMTRKHDHQGEGGYYKPEEKRLAYSIMERNRRGQVRSLRDYTSTTLRREEIVRPDGRPSELTV